MLPAIFLIVTLSQWTSPISPLYSNQGPWTRKPQLTSYFTDFRSSDQQNTSQNRWLSSPFPRLPVNHVEVEDWAGQRWSWLPDREINLPVSTVSISSKLFFLWEVKKRDRSPFPFLSCLWWYFAPVSEKIAALLQSHLQNTHWETILWRSVGVPQHSVYFSFCLFGHSVAKSAEMPFSSSLGTDYKPLYSGHQKISFHRLNFLPDDNSGGPATIWLKI